MHYNYEVKYKINMEELKEMIKLDQKVYAYKDAGIFDLCKIWYEKNSDIYTVLKYNNKIVGYINFMPLEFNFYNKYRSGKVIDNEIKPNYMTQFIIGEEHYCLLTSIVLDVEHRNGNAVKLLWNGLLKKLQEKQVIINNVIADCVSEDGEKFVKKLRFKFVNNSPSGKVYEGKL